MIGSEDCSDFSLFWSQKFSQNRGETTSTSFASFYHSTDGRTVDTVIPCLTGFYVYIHIPWKSKNYLVNGFSLKDYGFSFYNQQFQGDSSVSGLSLPRYIYHEPPKP